MARPAFLLLQQYAYDLAPGSVAVGGLSRSSTLTVQDAFNVLVVSKTASRNLYCPGWKALSVNLPSTGNAFTPFGGDKNSPVLQKGVLGPLTLNAFHPGRVKIALAAGGSQFSGHYLLPATSR